MENQKQYDAGRAWAQRVYNEKLADPAKLPSLGGACLGGDWPSELLAARAVLTIADRKLFATNGRTGVKVAHRLRADQVAFWRGVLDLAGELAIEHSAGSPL